MPEKLGYFVGIIQVQQKNGKRNYVKTLNTVTHMLFETKLIVYRERNRSH